MELVFAENFQNDKGETLERRYPGTRRDATGATDIPNAFPLKGWSTLNPNIKPFNPTENKRIEIILGLTNNLNVDRTGDHLSVFGVEFTTTATGLTIAGTPVDGNLRSVKKLHIVIDVVGAQYRMVAFADDTTIITPTIIDYTPLPTIHGTKDTWFSKLGNFLIYAVVAYDTAVNTRLKTPVFEEATYDLTETGVWESSEGTILEATNKEDPNQKEPYIYAETDTTLVINFDKPSNIYVTGSGGDDVTDQFIKVNGLPYCAKEAQVVTPKSLGSSVKVQAATLDIGAGVSNNDNVTFLGELTGTEFATFAELDTLLGVTQGTVNTIAGSNTYLHLIVDGKEVVVPKVSIKYSVSYNHIYSAGLVFGTDDYGLYVPEGIQPVNQKKVVTIKGQQYLVRLMKGCNGSEGPNVASGYDLPWTQRSEFSRIFYPLSNDSRITSYTDVKLASYTPVELGLEGVNGSYVWVQERPLNVNTNRFVRGNPGPARVSRYASSYASAYNGLRPAFFKI